MAATEFRYRIRFGKTGPMRFTGHLDVQRAWDRTLRRGRIATAYTEGFHPRARMSFAGPLPLGFTSSAELLDIWLTEPCDNATTLETLQRVAAPGVPVFDLGVVPANATKPQAALRSAIYRAEPREPCGGLGDRVTALLQQEQILRQRRGKSYDLRPLIDELGLAGEDSPRALRMTLAARDSATGRPDEVVAALGYDPETWRFHREQVLLSGR